ncbi:MAG: hypothetical protein CL912_00785 [Deltaproteobacteria bacterium]|nr:hypothetical protein [Deltaproteobacteria bacterium]|tara:strand:- start:90 stop:317 length:228 start_codon:yes stop_codon:yes gene_type:complete
MHSSLSTNILSKAIYWETITGHLPLVVPTPKKPAEGQEEDPSEPDPTVANDLPVMVDLGTLADDVDVALAFDVIF